MTLNKILKNLLFAVVAGVVISFSACEKNNMKSPKQLLAEEQEILDRFKLSDTYLAWFEEAEMVADSSDESGLVYFQLEKGTGDTVQVGKAAGFRFNMYYVLDSVGAESPFLRIANSNYGAANPTVYVVGQPDSYSGIYIGVDLGIRKMNRYGKSRVLVPSPIGGNDYVTRVYEVEVSYLGK